MGQIGTYVAAVDDILRKEGDAPTVGLLVCKNKDNVLAQYAVNSSNAPVGISEYELSDLMPENFKGTLPSIEEIERELKWIVDNLFPRVQIIPDGSVFDTREV